MKTKQCQYSKTGCQKTATYQHILKLGAVNIDKGYICQNCKEFIEHQRKEPEK